MSAILGLNAYHADSSACLFIDGQLVAAAEEERFRRQKHWAGFPSEAIRSCLAQAGISLDRVEHVAINRDPRANLGRRLRFALLRRPSPRLLLERLSNARAWGSVGDELRAAFPGELFTGQVHHVEHHLAHIASAFLVSPFEESALLSVDGSGDFASAAWGAGRRGDIRIDGRVYYPHSLGVFYQALTQFLGFPNYGDEYKVMGLAPYGEPRYVDTLRRVLRLAEGGGFRLNLDCFRHHRERTGYQWNGCTPSFEPLYSRGLVELLGPRRAPGEEITARHRDLARSVQAVYEEAFFHLLGGLHARTGADTLSLAGGCAMNSVANGKIHARSPFVRSYVPAAAGDAGGAIGAAAWVARQVDGGKAATPMTHAFWGPSFSDTEVRAALDARRVELAAAGCTIVRVGDERELCGWTAAAIADGKVVGWFQGRMEWGPRALGGRSILADPRRPEMKDVLNRKIKRRESFRPFAPSVLREAVSCWFETDDDVPFMGKVFQIRADKRPLVPAVTHVDGSGRLQTVDREANPRYHALIAAFAARTGVPMVLNTSFNENEPVVHRPDEALDCFLRTEMDILVLGEHVVERT